MSITSQILLKHGLDEKTSDKFDKYYRLLSEWNEKINLTAITDETDVANKHFIDSLSVFKCGKIKDSDSVIDVGTGAGFPGLPMKICSPKLKITLMDSLNKRLNFLNEVINELNLSGIETVHARAEELGRNKKYREKFDVCVSRAVANLASLTELCLPFIKENGYFLSLKGPKAEEEIKSAQNAIRLLGGELEGIYNYDIDETDLNHNIVIIKKISKTDSRYPRNAPKPIKEPLL